MGQGYYVKCNKCGYDFAVSLGVGYIFPTEYEDNVIKMKKGKLGPEAKQFFKEYPNGVINSERAVAKCKECGNYDEVYDLTMYKPKEGISASDNVSYIFADEIKENYIKYMDYPHKCSRCNGKSKVYKSFEKKIYKNELKCPRCDGMMCYDPKEMILWD